MWLWIIAFIVLYLLWYAVWGDKWLRQKPWMKGWFELIEPIEIALWKKSRTIFLARLKIVTGVLLTLLTQLGTIDLSPLYPFIDDKYEPLLKLGLNMMPLVLTVLGMVDERLRNETTQPVEIVALPQKIAATMPEVGMAVEAKDKAVAAAVEAKRAV